MPLSPYESLTKEYLETEGYLVYNNLKIPTEKGNEKEVDILAYSPTKGAIIGEVKTFRPLESNIKPLSRQIKNKKEAVTKFISKKYGIRNHRTILYCSNAYSNDNEISKYAKSVGIDEVVTFPRMVKVLLNEAMKKFDKGKWFYDVNRPNTVLLQIIYDALYFDTNDLKLKDFPHSKCLEEALKKFENSQVEDCT